MQDTIFQEDFCPPQQLKNRMDKLRGIADLNLHEGSAVCCVSWIAFDLTISESYQGKMLTESVRFYHFQFWRSLGHLVF